MGQNKEAKKTNNMRDEEYRRTGQQYDDFYNSRESLADESRGRANQAYDTAFAGYQDIANNPRSGGGSRYYDEFAKTGGLTDENIRRMRGNGVFDEFSQTGGLSQDDIANMRLYGSKTIPGFFDSVKRNLEHSTNVSGYNPGYSGQTRQLARDQSRAAQDAALNTELGIVDTRNKGRQWGTEGLSGAENNVVAAQQRGRMFGIEGLDRSSQQSNADRLAALSGIRGLRTDQPGEVGMYEDELTGTMGAGAAGRRGLIQDRAAYNPNQSWFDKYGMPLLNAGAGVAAGFASGGASRAASQGQPTGGNSFSNFFRGRSGGRTY